MARALNRLTVKAAEKSTVPGRYTDGGGLYLDITRAGSKSWVFLYRSPIHRARRGGKDVGRLREMGLGAFGTGEADRLSLARARVLAENARRLIKDGLDPLDERRKPAPTTKRTPTFGEIADAYVSTMEAKWKNPKHQAQWRMTLKTYAAPLRDKPVNTIEVADVLGVLQPIWSTIPETASRLRGRIERVLAAAKAAGHRTGENAATWRGHLDTLLPPRGTETRRHHASLPWRGMPAFVARLREREGIAALALEFGILTAARSSEIREARWDEIDLESAVWTIPGYDPETGRRMKSGREHIVPLVPRTVEIIETVAKLPRGIFVFPGHRPNRPLSDMSLSAVLRRMGIPSTVATQHGFRGSFKSWVIDETEFANELSEAALAHVVGDKTEAAYRRTTMLERRRRLMLAWAHFLETGNRNESINVVPLRALG
jgi:integrase